MPGTLCRSALVDRDGRLERLDFVQTAWTGPPAGTVGHWRCTVPVPATVKARTLNAEELLAEFERMEDDGHLTSRRLRYVLALLLLQRRRFNLDGTRTDGEIEYLVVSGSKGEGPFEVRDEALPPEELAAAQRELMAALLAESDAADLAAETLAAAEI